MEIAPCDNPLPTISEPTPPSGWKNPAPAARYNLVVLGGGDAGRGAASVAAAAGARVALVELGLLQGAPAPDGRLARQALSAAARGIRQVSRGAELGFALGGPVRVDCATLFERVRRLAARSEVAPGESGDWTENLRREGVDVFAGAGRFTGPDTLDVGGQSLRFRRALIVTGALPALFDCAGLDDCGVLTSDSVSSLIDMPRTVAIVGAGATGCELAQALARLGSETHLIERGNRILRNEDPAAAAIVQAQLAREGVHLHLDCEPVVAEKAGPYKCLTIERAGGRQKIVADAVLIAVGRRPNVQGLGLEAAGVKCTGYGIEIDDHFQTTNPAVFAAGGVCSRYRSAHAADAMARASVRNALLLGRQKASALVIPRCTFTDPELAQVGLTPAEAAAKGVLLDSYHVELKEIERAKIDGDEAGFAVVHTRRGKGQIVGATIVARNAGDVISEITLAMTGKLSLAALARTIHCTGTTSAVWKSIAAAYSAERRTPGQAKLLGKWLAWQR